MVLEAVDANTRQPVPQNSLSGRNPSSIKLLGEDDGKFEFEYKYNCNEIRKRINAFLKTGEMKVTEFQRELKVNSNSYGRFMKLRGPWSGAENQTMEAAYLFFKKRDLCGVKNQKKKTTETKEMKKATDVSDITLPGEDDQDVPVYDTCDDIRRKITKHLRETNTSKAAFCRAISDAAKTTVSARVFDTFTGRKGSAGGASSPAFYSAYVYFEKLRVKEKAKKSKKRVEMEETWGLQGMPFTDSYGHFIVPRGARPQWDTHGVYCPYGY